ncbi:MAG: galactokinase family protein [Gemmatimonadota bacterium]
MSSPATFFVPGRIEVLGKHTDYAGGRSLLAATRQGFTLEARPALSGEVRVVDMDTGRNATFPLGSVGGQSEPGPADVAVSVAVSRSWERYPAVVVQRIARDFPGLEGGAALAFSSTLPAASGLSSSSALVVAVFLGMASALDLPEREDFQRVFGAGLSGGRENRERLAAYLAAVESGRPFPPVGGRRQGRGVGTDGGSEDHAAILCAEAGHLVRYRFRPTRFEGAVAVPDGWVFAMASSGVLAEKAEGARDAYNRLSEETRRMAELWREETGGEEPHLGAILASDPDARKRLDDLLIAAGDRAPGRTGPRAGGGALSQRLHQFATESNELVPLAVAALEQGDLDDFGRAVARSQALTEEVLDNQVPETAYLVREARELGAPAASAFGAGFGGAVWALTRRDGVEDFLDAWRVRYLGRFPDRGDASRFIWTEAGPAASRRLPGVVAPSRRPP